MDNVYNLENFVDEAFSSLDADVAIDTDNAIEDFKEYVEKYSNAELVSILTVSGYIPDLYVADSSEETLYTKLCEVLEVTWAERMGYQAYAVTQKASYEDVVIEINGKAIVSDTKTFRLSRSQGAPNVKDFVKPEDYSKWIGRHKGKNLGGLVVYPQLHEWKQRSDAYSYCSNKDNPILMLPSHYLAFFLKAKGDKNLNFDVNKLANLWDFERIFPQRIGTRTEYWNAIDSEIIKIVGCSKKYLTDFLREADDLLREYVNEEKAFLIQAISERSEVVKKEVESLSDEEIRAAYTSYKIDQETQLLHTYIGRINEFRLKGQKTIYSDYIAAATDQNSATK